MVHLPMSRIRTLIILAVHTLTQFTAYASDSDHENKYSTGVYYTEWSFYDNHFPADIPLSHVTNIYYAFSKIGSDSTSIWDDEKLAIGENIQFGLSDFNATMELQSLDFPGTKDVLKEYNDNLQNIQTKNLQSVGLVGQLSQMKNLKQGLKVSLSVGGANTDSVFAKLTSDHRRLEKFTDSIITTMLNYGFDGLDIDWEFPTADSSANMGILIHELKTRLRRIEEEKGLKSETYLLTMALPLDILTLKNYDFENLKKDVTHFNLMGYDITGPWSEKAGYHSNLYSAQSDDSGPKGPSVDTSVKYLLQHIDHKQLVLGMPSYGRSYNCESVDDYFDDCASIPNVKQDKKECIVNYEFLPPKGYKEFYNSTIGSSYAVNEKNGGIIFYDGPEAVRQKANYVKNLNLAGGVWWNSAGDQFYKNTERSLLLNFVQELGGVATLKTDTGAGNEDLYSGSLDDEPEQTTSTSGCPKPACAISFSRLLLPFLTVLYLYAFAY